MATMRFLIPSLQQNSNQEIQHRLGKVFSRGFGKRRTVLRQVFLKLDKFFLDIGLSEEKVHPIFNTSGNSMVDTRIDKQGCTELRHMVNDKAEYYPSYVRNGPSDGNQEEGDYLVKLIAFSARNMLVAFRYCESDE